MTFTIPEWVITAVYELIIGLWIVYGVNWVWTMIVLNGRLKTKNERLTTALNRVMKEVEMNTERDFYAHCKSKVDRILETGK